MWKCSRSFINTTKQTLDIAKTIGRNVPAVVTHSQCQIRRASDGPKDATITSLFKPVHVKANPDTINVGTELAGKINKAELLKVLNNLMMDRQIKALCKENGLTSKMWTNTLFRAILNNNAHKNFCYHCSRLAAESLR